MVLAKSEMVNPEFSQFKFNEYSIPVRIYRERRLNARAGIGQDAILIRLPKGLGKSEEIAQIERFKIWVKKQLSSRPEFRLRFIRRLYKNNDELVVRNKHYHIILVHTKNKGNSVKLHENQLHIKLGIRTPKADRQKTIRQLISKAVSKDFLPEISYRVEKHNKRHFQQNINSIRLKYLHSRWGSCSSKHNINLSSRLLFAPDEVIDYIIIHELAHLIELNHSPRFWALVEKAMPEYKKHEKWLKENDHLCDF